MSLKNLFVIGAFSAALVACGSSITLTAPVEVDAKDSARVIQLLQASERVLIRRFAGAEVKDAVVSVAPTSGSGGIVTMKLPDDDAIETAKRILGDSFTFEMKLAVGTKLNEEGVEETEWESTGVDGNSLMWIQPIRNPNTGELGVELQFDKDGMSKITDVFTKNEGKDLGIFVRDLLVSKLTIGKEAVGDSIVINGIPSERIAEIFADDVNVGLHVHFSVPQ